MRPENDFGSAEILELMHFRDQVFASAAEEAERKIRYSLLKNRVHRLEEEFIEQTDLLRENMTRAYNAEKKIVELQSQINNLIHEHQSEIQLLRTSRTWRIGHFFLTPIRLLRVLKRT
jgi:hypothetical protein